jgi:ABC-type nitrate/sulfonate/bicarbonate transport system permease component
MSTTLEAWTSKQSVDLRRLARRSWLPVALIVAWWVTTEGSESFYVPSLRTVMETFAADWLSERFISDLLPSLRNLALGFAIAGAVGVAGGMALGSVRWLAALFGPLIHFVRSLPPPVLLPLAIVAFGTGTSMKVAIIAIGAVWPTLLAAIDGVRSTDPQLRDMAAVYGLTRSERFRYILLPAAAPQIAGGLRTTLQISIILIVVSEMVASTGGIGYYVLLSQQTFAVPETWAGTLLLGLVGYLCNIGFVAVERRLLGWQQGMRAHTENR